MGSVQDRREPIGNVNEFMADGQRIGMSSRFEISTSNESDSMNSPFPISALVSPERQVISARVCLATIVGRKDENRVAPQIMRLQKIGNVPDGFIQNGNHPGVCSPGVVFDSLLVPFNIFSRSLK